MFAALAHRAQTWPSVQQPRRRRCHRISRAKSTYLNPIRVAQLRRRYAITRRRRVWATRPCRCNVQGDSHNPAQGSLHLLPPMPGLPIKRSIAASEPAGRHPRLEVRWSSTAVPTVGDCRTRRCEPRPCQHGALGRPVRGPVRAVDRSAADLHDCVLQAARGRHANPGVCAGVDQATHFATHSLIVRRSSGSYPLPQRHRYRASCARNIANGPREALTVFRQWMVRNITLLAKANARAASASALGNRKLTLEAEESR